MAQLPPLPPGFTLDSPGAAPVGRPVIRKGAEPTKPDLPEGWQVGPDGVARPVPGLPEAFTQPKASGSDGPKFIPQNTTHTLGPNNEAIPIAGLPKGGSDQRRADTIRSIMGEVRGLYEQDIKGQPANRLFGLTEKIDSLPSNERFRAAGANLLPLIRPLIAQSAKEGDSDREMLIFESYTPTNDDSDVTIEQKFKMLDLLIGGMVDGVAPSETLTKLGSQQAQPGSNEAVAVPPVPLAPSAGETRSVVDPNAQKVAAQVGSLIAKGADFNRVMGAAVRLDPTLRNDPRFRKSVEDAIGQMKRPEVRNYVQKTGNYPFDPTFYTREEPLSAVESGLTQAAQTAPGAFVARAGDAVTAGNLDRLAGMTGADAEGARLALQFAGRDNPTAALLGDITGGTLAALSGEAGLARLGVAPGLLRGAVADAGYGGVTNASNATEGNFLGNLAKGALIGGGASVGGQGLLRGTGAVARGVTSPSVRYVEDLGVPLTVGQAVGQSGIVGKAVKGLEDRAAGFSGVGDSISDRRLEGLAKLNSKAFDRALEPIGQTVAGQYAEEAVQTAQEKVSGAFQRALGGKVASLDRRFIVEAEKAKMGIEKLPPRVAGEVDSSVNEAISNYFDDTGNISGENMQALLRDLDGIKRGYRNDPLGHRIGKSVDMVSASVENLFRRQAPDVMPQYDAAKKAFQRLSTLEDAVLRAKNTGGIFTPAQLGMSDRASTVKFGGKHKAAAGGGEFHDMQRKAQEVLPNKVPDSGTAGRLAPLLVPGALAGSGAGLGYPFGSPEGGATAGLGLGGLLMLAYSRTGQRALVGGVSRRGPVAQKIGRGATASARLGGAASGAALSGPRD